LTGVERSTRMGMREDRPQAQRALASFSQTWLGLFIASRQHRIALMELHRVVAEFTGIHPASA
jgi:hypothetical protein